MDIFYKILIKQGLHINHIKNMIVCTMTHYIYMINKENITNFILLIIYIKLFNLHQV